MKLNKKLLVIATSSLLLMAGCEEEKDSEPTSELTSQEVESDDIDIDVSEDGVVFRYYEVKDKKYLRAGRIEQGFMTVPGDFTRIKNEEIDKNQAIQFADAKQQNKITWAIVNISDNPDITTEGMATKLLEKYQQLEVTQDQVEFGKVEKTDVLENPIVVVLKQPEKQILTLFFQNPKAPKEMYTIAIEGTPEFVKEYTQLIFSWVKEG